MSPTVSSLDLLLFNFKSVLIAGGVQVPQDASCRVRSGCCFARACLARKDVWNAKVCELNGGLAQCSVIGLICLGLPTAAPLQLLPHKGFQVRFFGGLFMLAILTTDFASVVAILPLCQLLSTHADEECQSSFGCITLRLLL